MKFRSLVFLFVATTVTGRAHPELAVALDRVNGLIAAAPGEAVLYVERGELYAQAGETISADANFHVAAALSPYLPRLARAQAALALATHRPHEAVALLEQTLAADPRDAEALILRARARNALQARTAAAADFAAAIELLEQPAPEIFLEHASCAETPVAAIRALEVGLERLGAVPSLIERALEIEVSAGLIDAAVARIDRLVAQAERREFWLKRRGDLLARAGRKTAAEESYAAARAALAALPAWLQHSPAALRFRAELPAPASPDSSFSHP